MYWLIILIPAIIAGLFLLLLFLIKPNGKRLNQFAAFQNRPVAHRGLFRQNEEYPVIPENSLPAFRRAVEAGYGIELDVQMTIDGKLVVFHDEDLLRMCGIDRILHQCSYEELQKYCLMGTEEKIPLFSEVLKEIDGRSPLVVEIKSEGDWLTTTRKTCLMLDHYSGLFCVESFHPLVLSWIRKNRPQILRGQLSSNFFKEKTKQNAFGKWILTNLMLNATSRPDFIAYNFHYADQWSYRLLRRFFPAVHVAWTVRSEKDYTEAKKVFSVIIFDSFIPKE